MNGFKSMGIVEIFYNGTWGTVCAHNFNSTSAKVICRQLGYRDQINFNTLYGNGSGPIWLDNVICNGYESTVAACRHSNWGINNCTHNNDVGITCFDSKFIRS